MRLEHLCTFDWSYDRGGERFSDGFTVLAAFGDEGAGYGEGRGPVSGRVSGSSIWSNHPRRRGDQRMLPDVHGLVETDDGARIVFDLHGRSIFTGGGAQGRMVLVGSFATEDERYRWLNDAMCVAEGVFVPAENRIEVRAYVAVNELE
jgi:Protein of unknown function (DUF3237)